jgi:hypothetical protein
MSTLECVINWGYFFKLVVGNNFDAISVVNPNIPPPSHRKVANQKLEVGQILEIAMMIT